MSSNWQEPFIWQNSPQVHRHSAICQGTDEIALNSEIKYFYFYFPNLFIADKLVLYPPSISPSRTFTSLLLIALIMLVKGAIQLLHLQLGGWGWGRGVHENANKSKQQKRVSHQCEPSHIFFFWLIT